MVASHELRQVTHGWVELRAKGEDGTCCARHPFAAGQGTSRSGQGFPGRVSIG
jgi:hypothetical protein